MKLNNFLFVVAISAITGVLSCSKNSDEAATSVDIALLSYSALPSSQYHQPNSTWWGYNMSKIARYGSNVYYGIIQDDTGTSTSTANFKIYKKPDNGSPILVASIPTSRPGNVLIDNTGRLHAIIFEPHTISQSDWIGSLVHYQYDNVETDDFALTLRTVINQAPNANTEVVNIRIGATTNSQGHLAVAHGLYSDPSDFTHAEYLYTKSPSGSWVTQKTTNLPHEYYYPFIVYSDAGKATITPVQDDFVSSGSGNYNRYYKIPLMTFSSGVWNSQMMLDLSNDPLAVSDQKPNLVEASELFEKTNGEIISIYKDKRTNNYIFKMRTISAAGTMGSETSLDWATGMNWVRAFEIDGELYFLANSYDSAYIAKSSTGVAKKINLPGLKSGTYSYTSAGRGGSLRNAATTIDFFMVPGSSQDYPSPGTQLYQIPKQSIKNLF